MGRSRHYRQLLTYWAPTGGDDGYGVPVLAAPVVFKGHWSDKSETFLNAKGEQIVSRAIIHYPSDMTIIADGYLAQGIQTASDPRSVPGAIIIRMTSSIPDLRNIETINMAWV